MSDSSNHTQSEYIAIGRGWEAVHTRGKLGTWNKRLLYHLSESDDGTGIDALYSVMHIYGAKSGHAGTAIPASKGPRCSLRLINFFVVNYCKEEPVVIAGHDVYREYQHHLIIY